jgi:hypothetical protein
VRSKRVWVKKYWLHQIKEIKKNIFRIFSLIWLTVNGQIYLLMEQNYLTTVTRGRQHYEQEHNTAEKASQCAKKAVFFIVIQIPGLASMYCIFFGAVRYDDI